MFRGEIDSDWACEAIPLREGRNRVELFAVNGTGQKRNSSYATSIPGNFACKASAGKRSPGSIGAAYSIVNMA